MVALMIYPVDQLDGGCWRCFCRASVIAATSSALGPAISSPLNLGDGAAGANLSTKLDISDVANTSKVRNTNTVPMPMSMSSSPDPINDDMLRDALNYLCGWEF